MERVKWTSESLAKAYYEVLSQAGHSGIGDYAHQISKVKEYGGLIIDYFHVNETLENLNLTGKGVNKKTLNVLTKILEDGVDGAIERLLHGEVRELRQIMAGYSRDETVGWHED